MNRAASYARWSTGKSLSKFILLLFFRSSMENDDLREKHSSSNEWEQIKRTTFSKSTYDLWSHACALSEDVCHNTFIESILSIVFIVQYHKKNASNFNWLFLYLNHRTSTRWSLSKSVRWNTNSDENAMIFPLQEEQMERHWNLK